MNVSYEPAAREEVVEALSWHVNVAGATIADSLEHKLDAAVRLLMRFPRLGRRGPRESRSLRLHGFPYTLHYRIDGELIRNLAVAHQSRRPGHWRSR